MFEQQGREWHCQANMDTTCFHSLENISFEPLQWLGLYYYLVDLCHNVCFSLWDTSLLWKLCFHWIQDVFIKRQHVHLSCLSWSRSTCSSYVISLGTVNHDILGPLQLISLQTVSRKLIFFFGHGKLVMVDPCMYVSWIDFQNVCALLLLQLVTIVSRMHSEVQRRCQNKRFPAVQGFTEV